MPHQFLTLSYLIGVHAALRRLLEVQRPYEFDINLQPLTDTNPEVYAFPSLESYMSVVVFGHIFLATKNVFLLPLFAILTFLIGFSRIYSRSRFPHQIVGSWALGIFGLMMGPVVSEWLKVHKYVPSPFPSLLLKC